ncbi:N-acetyl-gamma-glutamyl-phosphate reductase [Bartonella tamiae]|uniref:N-acetyl-gamma-glutamyl-phosphate reductase n=1 Tax=Bartonella tamiae Th239 TaxID=1094558 RepID=J0QSL0_9HYPH|nr:N-acetyl-gamma-glutamyl-phosphate reductase [Bartonella tamiae]EJF88856.1 N-acetyl-gamma-glutamyl-phosphate reductase [Bartonella tamiae Th239]EJF94894.1 N-acetyl-gamma-glutamyl-phosphate reductase [Bartonella tamiae Th307]
MKTPLTVFIDGEHGTTGLKIRRLLSNRSDINLLTLPHDERHDLSSRLDRLNTADIAILCLPDTAAKDTINQLSTNITTRIIDSSSAFRTNPHWVYGFGEMTTGQIKRIADAQFISNPGCYPTGAISLIRPLREAGIIDEDYPISINAVSGYSGGGKQLIEQMENASKDDAIAANFFTYSLNLQHKHTAEIKKHALLKNTPLFLPSVGRFAQGMIVHLPLHKTLFKKSVKIENLYEIFLNHYANQKIISISTQQEALEINRLDPEMMLNTDKMKIYIFGNEKEGIFNLTAVLDNLGKGSSGAAVQNLNLLLGA